MRHFLLACGLAAGLLRAFTGAGQTLDNSFVGATSLYSTAAVEALGPAQADGKRLVATYVSRVNGVAATTGLLRLDATGALDQAFLQNVGNASTPVRIRGYGSGQYLLEGQGNSLVAGGVTRTELLRLNANGTGDASFDPGTGPDQGYTDDFVVQPDGKIVVGGFFESFNGQTARGVVRLNANGSVDNTFSVGTGISIGTGAYEEVMAMALQTDGQVLAGGHFASFNGQAAGALVRLTATGTRDASFAAPFAASDYIYGLLLQPDGKILVTGGLTVNGVRTSLARLLPSGALDPGFTLPSALGTQVYTTYLELPMVLQPDGKLVVVGNFDLPGYRRVARLNPDGSLDPTFQAPTGPNIYPATLGLQPSGSILVGGEFTAVGTTETPIAQLTSAGAVDASYAPKLQNEGSISAMARQADGSVLVGGDFTEWNGVAVHRVVRLSAAGVLDVAHAAAVSPLSGTVSTLLVQADGKAVVGTYANLHRLLPSGATDPDFAQFPTYTAYVTALAQQADGKLLVAGSLSSGLGGGAAYNRLTRLNPNGSFDTSFGAPASSVGTLGIASALLLQQDGRILLAANPTGTGLTRVAYVQRYETTGATDTSWPIPSFSYGTSTARVSKLVQQPDGKVLAGGRFTAIGGVNHSGITRLNGNGTVDAGFSPGSLLSPGGNGVTALAVQPNGRILAGGSFSAASATGSYTNLLRLTDAGQLDATFSRAANPNSQVGTIIVQPDGGILLQGLFTTVAGQARRNLARITAPNVLAVAAPAAVAERTTAWPVPTHDQLHVQPAATAHPLAAELLDALGRTVRQQTLNGTAEFTLATSGLPAGFYVLRVRYAEGTVARTISVE